MQASKEGHVEMIRVLVEAGADIDLQNGVRDEGGCLCGGVGY